MDAEGCLIGINAELDIRNRHTGGHRFEDWILDKSVRRCNHRDHVDHAKISREELTSHAADLEFEAFDGLELNQDRWLQWLRATPREKWPDWINTSQVTVVPSDVF